MLPGTTYYLHKTSGQVKTITEWGAIYLAEKEYHGTIYPQKATFREWLDSHFTFVAEIHRGKIYYSVSYEKSEDLTPWDYT